MATRSIELVDLAAAPSFQEPSSKQLLLNGYLRREELANQLGVSARTIDRWHTLRCGPPRVSVGRTVLFNIQSVREWLVNQERQALPARRRRSFSGVKP